MSKAVEAYLKEHGPTRSSAIADGFIKAGAERAAARQRLSRAGSEVLRFPIPLLPKRESFLYLRDQRNTERFWDNFLRDLRATDSVYGAALDGIAARGGLVRKDEMAVVLSAPVVPMKGQVPVQTVASRLEKAGFLRAKDDPVHGACFELNDMFSTITPADLSARRLAEGVLLDGIREWARNLGLASYSSIAIRGEPGLKPIGPFAFDLAGPSYLLPLMRLAAPGFLVADVFTDCIITQHQIQFFVRKCRMLKATRKDIGVLGLLVADGFTGEALTAGHAAGIVLATPRALFGPRVGAGLVSLVETLKRAAAYASAESPDRIVSLIESLGSIEGRAGNLRGILFELLSAYLARRNAVSIDLGVRARHPNTGKQADIDIQAVQAQSSAVTAIECKGKAPGATIGIDEVRTWLEKLATIQAYYRSHGALREAKLTFEFWTSASFEPDALALLTSEKAGRTKHTLGWKDGAAILNLAAVGKEKAIADALYQHFLKHPLATVSTSPELPDLPRPNDFPEEVRRYLEYEVFVSPGVDAAEAEIEGPPRRQEE